MIDSITGSLKLKRGREKPVLNKHPWVFSGAIQQVRGQPTAGDLVYVHANDGRALAIAYYNPHSQIRARIVTWDTAETIDAAFWQRRIERALAGRAALQLEPDTTAYRLINAEADGLPGLIVDQYDRFLVVQCLTLGIEKRKALLVQRLAETIRPLGRPPNGILERSDVAVRKKEGLDESVGMRWGTAPPEIVEVRENGYPFKVDLTAGHKTGLYLDQRDNRALLGQSRFVAGRRILNAFAYTGGFALYAAAGGADAIANVDSSQSVLELAEQNVTRISGERPHDAYIAGDAFEILRAYRDAGKQFDVVILDPPKFAHNRRQIRAATRGYKDINWLALRLLQPGGVLATFSCSGLIDADLFQKVLFGAAVDAERDVQILRYLHQAADHPVLLTFPESAYLKGFLCRVW